MLLSEYKLPSSDNATHEMCTNSQRTLGKGYSQLKIIPTVTHTLLSLSSTLMATLNPAKL